MHKVNDNSRALAKCTTPIKAKVMYNTCTKALHFPRPVVFSFFLYIEGAGNYTG